MDLALATGYGPPAVGDLEGRSPLVRVEDAVIVGFRDAEEQARDGSQSLPDALLALDLAAVRAAGARAAAEQALVHLTRPGAPDHFWVHVDADVFDDTVMPAVDYRQPGGLSAESSRPSSPPRSLPAASQASMSRSTTRRSTPPGPPARRSPERSLVGSAVANPRPRRQPRSGARSRRHGGRQQARARRPNRSPFRLLGAVRGRPARLEDRPHPLSGRHSDRPAQPLRVARDLARSVVRRRW
jgi:hypothetical protein